jgi:hypothetical protein
VEHKTQIQLGAEGPSFIEVTNTVTYLPLCSGVLAIGTQEIQGLVIYQNIAHHSGLKK